MDNYFNSPNNNNSQNQNIPNNAIQNNYEAIKNKRKRTSFSGSAVIAICLVCCILTSVISVTTMSLLGKYNTGIKSTPSTNSNLLNNKNEKENDGVASNPTDNNSSNQENITINVDNTNSPATAVAIKVSPSIVGIQVTTITNYGPYGNYESSGEGSGVIYTDDGYIITNYHVISNMLTSSGEKNPNSTLTVYLDQDTSNEISGEVIGYDQSADLAVIKINKTGLTEVEIGDSSQLKLGDTAIALGNPGGLEFMGSITQGIISGLDRIIQTEDSYENLTLIQTDAAINPGNSGGALCNTKGELIGINSVKLVETGYESMGFAIPSNDVVKICDSIIQNGNENIVYLGLEFDSRFTAELLESQGYPTGLVVSDIATDSPAKNAGFETDDILVSFNGVEIKSLSDLTNAKKDCSPGDVVYAKVYRLTPEYYGFSTRWVGKYVNLAIHFN